MRLAWLPLLLMLGCAAQDQAPVAAAPTAPAPVAPAPAAPAPDDLPPKEQCRVLERSGKGCDTEGIVAAVHSKLGPRGPIAACYRTHESQKRKGRLSFTIQLAPDGRAASVRVGSDTLGNPRLAGCLQRILADLQYPAPGDKPCTAIYPFDFR